MVWTCGIKHQTVIRVCPIHPGLHEVGNVHGQHAVILVGDEAEIGSAAVKIAAEQSPCKPGSGIFTPIGRYAIEGCGLTSLVILGE